MVLRSTKECAKQRLVEFTQSPRGRKKESLRFTAEAEYSLKSAEDFLKSKHFKYSVVAAYDSMEAAAKALLALKGIKPKMHKCVFLYLKQEFVESGLMEKQDLNALENAHTARVQVHYVIGSSVSEEKAKSLHKNAVSFTEKIKNIIGAMKP